MGGTATVSENAKAFTTGLPILKTTDAFGKTLGSGNRAILTQTIWFLLFQ